MLLCNNSPELSKETQEEHVYKLCRNEKDKLRSQELAFVYYTRILQVQIDKNTDRGMKCQKHGL